MDAPQILRDAEEWLAGSNFNVSGHDDNCHKRHSSCMVQRLAKQCRELLKAMQEMEDAKASSNSGRKKATRNRMGGTKGEPHK